MSLSRGIKALVLAGGRGKRLGGYTEDFNKAMLKFGDKYLIEFSLDSAAAVGVGEIVVVIGYQGGQIRGAIGDSYRGIPVRYVVQPEQRGVVHAIECGRSAVGDSDFILQLADEYFLKAEHPAFLRFFQEQRAFAACGIVHVEDLQRIRKTYSVQGEETTKRITRLIEKPTDPVNDIMGTGNILFKNEIYHYVPLTPTNPQRGEKELPDLIQCAINDDQKVLYYPIASAYTNVNTPEDLQFLERSYSGPHGVRKPAP